MRVRQATGGSWGADAVLVEVHLSSSHQHTWAENSQMCVTLTDTQIYHTHTHTHTHIHTHTQKEQTRQALVGGMEGRRHFVR